MLYTIVKVFSAVVCILPASVCRCFGNALGALCWPIVPQKRKRMAIHNIISSLAVNEKTAAAIAKQSTTRFGKMFLEVLRIPRLNAANIGHHVRMIGGEYLTEALSHGHGAVLATAHSGNWELLGAALAMHDYPLVAVVQKQTNAAMDRFINEYRTRAGMYVTYKTGVREMIRLLGDGKIVGLLIDQDAGGDGVFVDFLGRPASTPQGAAALARLKGAPIVPAFITENSDGSHSAVIHPPVWVNKTTDRDEDIRVTMQLLTKIVEQHIRKHPQEWFWLHNRWKHRPPKTRNH
ncbi:MAG: lysophospholipid acyltransferase family protein [Veillonellales bacterium]